MRKSIREINLLGLKRPAAFTVKLSEINFSLKLHLGIKKHVGKNLLCLKRYFPALNKVLREINFSLERHLLGKYLLPLKGIILAT